LKNLPSPQTLPLIDRWILTRLENLITIMNKYLEEYKFGELTMVFNNFWIYELCDIYLEGIKPRFRGGRDPIIPQTILFTLFDQGLRLLHPLMPFISEDLYQKLPNWPEKFESLCIAAYPTSNNWGLNAEEIEKEFNFAYGVVKTIRSLAASVNLPNNVKANTYVNLLSGIANAAELKKIIETEEELIVTLAKCGKASNVAGPQDLPKGCIMDIAGNTAEVYINVSEHINVQGEIARLQKKIEENEKLIEGVKKKMNVPDYDTKVPEKVKIQNQEKLDAYSNDNAKLNEALEGFKKLL